MSNCTRGAGGGYESESEGDCDPCQRKKGQCLGWQRTPDFPRGLPGIPGDPYTRKNVRIAVGSTVGTIVIGSLVYHKVKQILAAREAVREAAREAARARKVARAKPTEVKHDHLSPKNMDIPEKIVMPEKAVVQKRSNFTKSAVMPRNPVVPKKAPPKSADVAGKAAVAEKSIIPNNSAVPELKKFTSLDTKALRTEYYLGTNIPKRSVAPEVNKFTSIETKVKESKAKTKVKESKAKIQTKLKSIEAKQANVVDAVVSDIKKELVSLETTIKDSKIIKGKIGIGTWPTPINVKQMNIKDEKAFVPEVKRGPTSSEAKVEERKSEIGEVTNPVGVKHMKERPLEPTSTAQEEDGKKKTVQGVTFGVRSEGKEGNVKRRGWR